MSLVLQLGTKPKDLTAKTYGIRGMDGVVHLGDYEISMRDFLALAFYVLTNTDLTPRDQRLQFLKCMQQMRKVEGFDSNKKRLESPVAPIRLVRRRDKGAQATANSKQV